MLVTPKRNSVYLLLFLLVISCAENIEFSQYKSLENSSWKISETLTYQFDVTDTISPKNLFIHIRNNQEYEFSNLYLITELNFPNKTKIVDTLQYEMADEIGRFLGSGSATNKENKLFYKEKKIFPVSGEYTFSVRHAMRKNGEINPMETLDGIKDVGFSIENIN